MTTVAIGGVYDDGTLIDQFKRRWEHERTGVVSCRLNFRAYRFSNTQNTQLPKATFADKFRLLSVSDFARKLSEIESILPAVDTGEERIWGWNYVVYQEGRKLRTEMDVPGKKQGGRVYLFNGKNEFVFSKSSSSHSQVNINTGATGVEHIRLEDFRFIPTVTPSTKVELLNNMEGGRTWLKVGITTICCNPTNGFVYESSSTGLGNDPREVVYYQCDPLKLNGDFYIPQVVAFVFYHAGQLEFFSISVLESADVNISLDPQLFEKLDVPQGTIVVDKRPGAVPVPRKSSKDFESTSELIKAADTPLKSSRGFLEDEPEPKSFKWLWILVIVFGLAFVTSGVLIIRYRRNHSQ